MRSVWPVLALAAGAALIALLPGPGEGATSDLALHQAAPMESGAAIDDGRCTANFVFGDASGDLYIGTASHCFADGPVDVLDGCDTRHDLDAPGAEVRVVGATRPGVLAYSSWHAMRSAGETDRAACLGNDFALIRLDAADHAAAATAGRSATAGNVDLTLVVDGVPQQGEQVQGSDWIVVAKFATPVASGDSGAPVWDATGEPLGWISARYDSGLDKVVRLEPALEYAAQAGHVVNLA